ncbi:hypothetical protein TEA_016707 [Camellia sinensis var. sinensis]|uniref:Pentatricopeptide repeat-containing protein n=1 Tax=Camellia sinensis var. sinensis TaxID=542762 RepID=A0A4V3WR75_CAMSN|nr:hypothetical protein TEA_016707 [Camellia sinensis var. sinensis]
MKERNCKPDNITFATMIQAYNAQGMIEAAEDLENKLITAEGKPATLYTGSLLVPHFPILTINPLHFWSSASVGFGVGEEAVMDGGAVLGGSGGVRWGNLHVWSLLLLPLILLFGEGKGDGLNDVTLSRAFPPSPTTLRHFVFSFAASSCYFPNCKSYLFLCLNSPTPNSTANFHLRPTFTSTDTPPPSPSPSVVALAS